MVRVHVTIRYNGGRLSYGEASNGPPRRIQATHESEPAASRSRAVPAHRGHCCLLPAIAIAIAACSGGGTSEPTAEPDGEGGETSDLDAAPDFDFTLYQGEGDLGAVELTMADLQGKPVVLNFWAGLCPPCRAEMPDFQAFYDDNRDSVVVLGIDVGQFTLLGTQEDARILLNDLGVSYPAGYTEDDTIMRKYEVLGMPTTVFINSRGEVFRNWGGILDHEVLQDITDEMLAAEAG